MLNNNQNVIKISNLTVIYSNGCYALDNINFIIPRSSITALVGVNGAGKSTLFKSILGFLPIKKGDISIFNMPVKQALKNNLVSYVPQNEELDWSFPILVEDIVMMGRYGYMNFLRIPKKEDYNIVNEALERVSMIDLRKRQIGELSGGQKKRIFLARALAQKSQIIFLDEPFTGIDINTEESIIVLLKSLKEEGKLILVSTHDLGSVPEYCDHTILLNKTIIDYGLTDKVFNHENLEKTFGGTLRHFILNDKSIITDDEKALILHHNNNKL